jgi:glycerol-1-phosphate dehydrogenase [NAD(P)+]
MTLSTTSDDVLDWDALRAQLAGIPGLRPVGLRRVVIGDGTLDQIPALVAELRDGRGGGICILRDHTPKWTSAGDALGRREVHAVVGALLAPLGPVRELALGGPNGHVYADEATTGAAVAAVAGAAVLVTVGSGTLADLGKVAAAEAGTPHLLVQTAASVNGFADDQSVLVRSGVKRTVTSRWPDVLVVDSGVLAAAPPALNRAGFGDLLSMFTAPADWLLASAIGLPAGYRQESVDLVRPHGGRLLALAPRLAAGETGALTQLAELLTRSGVSMGATGSTAPSSGMEHLVSHLLDMRARASGHPAAPHGAQVGVGCLVAAATWERVRAALCGGTARLRLPDPDTARRRVEEAFLPLDPSGGTARECWTAYAAKLRVVSSIWPSLRHLPTQWESLDERLGHLVVGRELLATALRTVGAATTFAELAPQYTPDVAAWAVDNAHLMRDRFTVADLADLLGLDNTEAVAGQGGAG